VTGRLALLLLALFVAQDPEIDRLTDQLGHDEAAKRQQAERRLLEIGEPARPALARLAESGDAEVRTRAKAILASLDRATMRRKWLGPAWTVTLSEGEILLGDLPMLLKDQVPVPVRVPASVAGVRIRIGARETPVWEFLDRVCRAHGRLSIPLDRPEGAFALIEGQPSRTPTVYSGPFRIWLERSSIEERSSWKGCRLVLGIGWQPNAHPLNQDYVPGDSFEIREMTDETGKKLPIERTRDIGGSFTLDRTRSGVLRGYLTVAAPPAGVRRWSRIAGIVKMDFPAVVDNIEFKVPGQSIGKSVKAGGYTIRLDAVGRVDKGVTAEIHCSRSWGDEEAEKPRSRVGLRTRFRPETITVRGADGKSVPFESRSTSHSSSSTSESADVKGFFALEGEPEVLTVPFISESFEMDVPFEFKDVDVP